MDYENKHKEEIIRATQLWECGDITRENLEYIFPELAESEDERIREKLIDTFNFYDPARNSPFLLGIDKKDIIAWLEKQGKQKVSYTTIVETGDGGINALVTRELPIDGCDGKQKPIDNVETKDYSSIDPHFGKPIDKMSANKVEPKFKVRDKIRKKTPSSFDTDMEVARIDKDYYICNHIGKFSSEVVPFSKESCYELVEQKPTDKVETKFHKGQWIVWQDECYKVNYNGCGYELVDKNGLSILLDYGTIDENAHLWDVAKDAKDGDVLYSQKHNLIWIYKDNKHYYASINLNYADAISSNGVIVVPSDVCPANRVQRSILLQKIEEAGYEWSDKDRKLISKKELKKVENVYEPDAFIEESYQQQADDLIDMVIEKSTWSEEDWNYIADLISYFNGSSLQHDTPDVISWLKSFKPQNTWKPSDEQMKALRDLNLTGNISYAGQGQTLIELYNDLKKLREE